MVKLTQWLLEHGAEVNSLDRFNRTPLEEACRGRFVEVIKLLIPRGAKVYEKGKLLPLQDSRLAGILNMQEVGVGGLDGFELDPEWEIDPRSIELLDRLGEGSFGTVFRGRYRGTIVAVKVLNQETDVALGDFRTEIGTLKKISHPNAVQFLGAVTKQKPYMLGKIRAYIDTYTTSYPVPIRNIPLNYKNGPPHSNSLPSILLLHLHTHTHISHGVYGRRIPR